VNLTLAPGDRLALLGRNGAGKSTCMKLLAGVLQALAAARAPRRASCASATSRSISSSSSRPTNRRSKTCGAPAARAPRATEAELRDYLATFGFRGDRVFEPVAPFSGGEKARLVLALVALPAPNLLLLDEPTNHLDLEMRQALAVALQDYGRGGAGVARPASAQHRGRRVDRGARWRGRAI
jgi:ATP-binding cassette subfamily F protein 3